VVPQNSEPDVEPQILWQPDPAQIEACRLTDYQRWLARHHDVPYDVPHEALKGDYAALWQWSVDDLEKFWLSIWQYFEVIGEGDVSPVLASKTMPGAQWFPNAKLNYAEQVFRHVNQSDPQRPALIMRSESGQGHHEQEISWQDLRAQVGALAASLRRLGIHKGDCVAAYLPNRAETVIAFLACASIGAIWSSCSPDMGVQVASDRFKQIAPRLLLATDGYRYNGKQHDRVPRVAELLQALPSVQHVVHVPGLQDATPDWRDVLRWDDLIKQPANLQFERLPFSHPLWVVYSSGTTGLPKAIVHSQGGIVLTHLKTMGLQHDLRAGDRLLFLGGTGWIVWNLQVGGLLTGATLVLNDGNPAWPDQQALWRFIDEREVTLFGCGTAYLRNCMKAGVQPRQSGQFEKLRAINATGSPLPVEAFRWVYAAVKSDLWLASISGGTDIASGFVACAPTLPVVAGEIQCRELGVAAYAFNDTGQKVVDEVGELVITQPMPSMPLYFWNDENDARYRASYFGFFPGPGMAVWRHGDWIRFTPRGTSIIYGRSDSTINRFGIRMGTAEIYRVVEALPEVRDSLVVDLEYLGRASFMPLFVVLHDGLTLDAALRQRLFSAIRQHASPRHVPNEIYQVLEVPRTLTGKKMEVPIRRLLLGEPVEKVAQIEAMSNPHSLAFFVELAQTLKMG